MPGSLPAVDFIDQLDQNIFIKDLDSNYLYCNSGYAAALGIEKDAIVGKNDFDFFDEGKARRYREQDREIIANASTLFFKEEILLEGNPRFIKVEKKPLYSQGELIGILGVYWDITDEMQRGKELAKTEQSLIKAQAIGQMGHWEYDFTDGTLFCSDELYALFGHENADFLLDYEAILDSIHPDDRTRFAETYSASKRKHVPAELSVRILKQNGELAHVDIHLHYVTDDDGTVHSMLGTVHDISRLKETEQNLLLASKVYEKTNNGVLITNSQGEIVSANDAFLRMTGYTLAELLGSNPRLFQSGWHSEEFYAKMWATLTHSGSWNGEVWDRKKSGELYAAQLSIFELRDNRDETTHYIGISSDITEQKEKEQRIHNMAYYDTLTKLPNRQYFTEKVHEQITVAKKHGERFSLLFFDLDNFKTINDTMGHLAGDELLVEVGRRINGLLRKGDMLARLSGDEFVLMLTDTVTDEQVKIVARKILNAFAEPLKVSNKKIQVGMSIGISVYPDNGDNFETLLKNADMAMYHIKQSGKSGYQFYTSIMSEEAKLRSTIEQHIADAIDNDELYLVYQPKVNMRSNKVYGMEALLRWQHPKLGLLKPEQFIPIAEETGEIYPIGLWVARQALHDMKVLYEEGLHNLNVSINISSLQLSNDHFVDDMLQLLEHNSIRHGSLEMEITERCLMRNREKISEKLSILSQNNVRLTLDNFGTGYTSLGHLKKLPVSTLKIDKNFILDIDKDDDMRSVASAIIALAKNLNMEVVAEGTESQEHVENLKALNCDNAQGYHLGRPMRIDDFVAFLHASNSEATA